MNSTKLLIIVPDADGAAYSIYKYKKLMIEIINRHYDFFKEYGEKPMLDESDIKTVKEKTEAMINEIPSIPLEDKKLFSNEMHPDFRKEWELTYEQVIQDYPDMIPEQVLSLMLSMFIQMMNRFNPQLLKEIFLTANKAFIDYLAEQIEGMNELPNEQPVEHVIFTLGTNRQTCSHDLYGMEQNGTDSFYLNISDLCDALFAKLPASAKVHLKTCMVSPFTLADIYGNYKRGTSFAKTVEERKNKTGKPLYTDHANFVYDYSKLTLIYGIAHDTEVNILKELGLANENTDICMVFFDNEKPIHQSLCSALDAYPQLLPKNMTVGLFHYDGDLDQKPMGTFKGEGLVDHKFPTSIKLLAFHSGHDLKDYTMTIDASIPLDKIKQFLEDRDARLNPTPALSGSPLILMPKPVKGPVPAAILEELHSVKGSLRNIQ